MNLKKYIKKRLNMDYRKQLTAKLGILIFGISVATQALSAFITVCLINYIPQKFSAFITLTILTFLATMFCISILIGLILTFCILKFPMKPLGVTIDFINKLAEGNFEERVDLHAKSDGPAKNIENSLNRLAEELQNNEMFRSDFINDFSHEFKTPIVSIRGFAKLLKNNELSQEDRDEYLNIIIEESTRLSNLSTNVLNLSKLERQNIQTNNSDFNFAELIRRDILMLETKWNKKNINLEIELEEITYHGDANLISQVIINLLDNAIKFSPKKGDILISLKRYDGEDHTVIFTVSDHGIGMNDEQVKRIFDKFYQADRSHSTEGNGLGLTVVKRIVDMYNGSIEIKSAPDDGCTFIITL
ncbi:MAG: HAMP domain-containing histidine kinase [Lachnospiraceae bacterium]|nr:HAMP domain-containing histidine kinase [Lachnospiraceae bacterium]